jgi:LysM repeat protein
MVNVEAVWNQHEPNTNMARTFVFLLLIHVVGIGGIVIYDWFNGDEPLPASIENSIAPSVSPSSMPKPAVNSVAARSQFPIEDCSTYEWRSGDSISSVARKLGVTEEVLIRMNMLDKGTQLEANSIIRYPKQPVVKAVGVSVADAGGELSRSAPMPVATPVEAPAKEPAKSPVSVPAVVSMSGSESSISLTAPGEQTFSFKPTIENDLAATPGVSPVIAVPSIQNTPPASLTKEAVGIPAVAVVKKEMPLIIEEAPPAAPLKKVSSVADALPKVEAKAEPRGEPRGEPRSGPKAEPRNESKAEVAVPKAIAVSRDSLLGLQKIADSPPAAKELSEPAGSKLYTVKPNDTLYGIAIRNGITLKTLQAANKNIKAETLRVGAKLVIPAKP